MARLRPAGESLRLQLESAEVEVLTSLAEGLRSRLSGALQDGATDALIDRLAPTVSRGDADLDAELRGMLRGELLGDRVDRLGILTDALRSWQDAATGAVDHLLDRDGAMRTVEALNDLRLALATTIGSDDALRDELPQDDPHQEAVRLMDALAWLQGGLIDYVDGDG
jgi:hypothetical protein